MGCILDILFPKEVREWMNIEWVIEIQMNQINHIHPLCPKVSTLNYQTNRPTDQQTNRPTDHQTILQLNSIMIL